MSITELKKDYSFPPSKPNYPEDKHGWFDEENKKVFQPLIKNSKIIIEIGSWLGLSTRFWLEQSDAQVICIDTWLGSSEHVLKAEWKNRLPTLYEVFCVNQWAWQDRLIPIRALSTEGLAIVKKYDVNPDFIYIDASHEYDDVLADLIAAHTLFPTATLIGDDWSYIHKFSDRAYKTVQAAVLKFCEIYDLKVEAGRWPWIIKQKNLAGC